jgi:hypothetical protein
MTGSSRGRTSIMDVSPLMLVLPPFAVVTALWWSGPNSSEPAAIVYAFLLLLMPWGSFLCWRQGGRDGLPVFAMIGGAYWLFFGLALLWGPRELHLTGSFRTYIPPEGIVTDTMSLTFVGVVALWMGMRVPVFLWVPANLPDIVDEPKSWVYVRAVLLIGIALQLYSRSVWLLGAGGRQAMTTLATVVPNVAFVLLLWRYLGGRASRTDKAVLIGSAVMLVLGRLASGWLGSVAGLAVLYGSAVLLKRRRIPWLAVCLTAMVVLFLQVGKNEFRAVYWADPTNDGSVMERVRFWLERSASQWGAAFESGDSEGAQSLASMSLRRTSLLTQVAHVIDLTPSQVPFQNGATYKYLAVTFIPRFLWPDKPSVNEANRFYQVAYAMTTETGLEDVSIAVGFLAEGYINFGWAGVIGIMFATGLALGVYERTLGLINSSSLFLGIGLALIPGFLTIESQLGQYFGGVIQQALLAAAVFVPVAKRRGGQERAVPNPTYLMPATVSRAR